MIEWALGFITIAVIVLVSNGTLELINTFKLAGRPFLIVEVFVKLLGLVFAVISIPFLIGSFIFSLILVFNQW